jgi:hypothetical protein
VSTGDDASFDEHAKALQRMGFAIFTDERTAKHFTSIGVKVCQTAQTEREMDRDRWLTSGAAHGAGARID